MGALYDRLATLDVEIEGVDRDRLEFEAVRWVRVSTVVRFHGGGLVGRGEDVSYAPADQEAHQRVPPPALAGRRQVHEWSELLDAVNLFPVPPSAPEARDYRRWAYDSALLDLALQQAGMSLAEALGRQARPVRFCASPAGDPMALLAAYPSLELKVDARADWSVDEMAALAGSGRVRVVDLKGHYSGDWNRHPDDPPAFAAAVAQAFPDVVIEDPQLGPGMEAFVAAHADRISFDAPVHGLDDLLRLPQTRWCNIKPSRFATARRLLEVVEHCERAGIAMYGGGQFEIGPGRTQIQEVASVMYADAPNDVAPSGYNSASPVPGLPESPLDPLDGPGFGA